MPCDHTTNGPSAYSCMSRGIFSDVWHLQVVFMHSFICLSLWEATSSVRLTSHSDAEDTHAVYDWRLEAERALRAAKGSGMTDEQVVEFVNGCEFMYARNCIVQFLYLTRLPGLRAVHGYITVWHISSRDWQTIETSRNQNSTGETLRDNMKIEDQRHLV